MLVCMPGEHRQHIIPCDKEDGDVVVDMKELEVLLAHNKDNSVQHLIVLVKGEGGKDGCQSVVVGTTQGN